MTGLRHLLMSAVMLATLTAHAQTTVSSALTVTSATKEFETGLEGELQKIAATHRGVMGIYYRDLTTSDAIAINADEPFETASTIKTPVMCAAFDLLAKGNKPFKSYYDTRPYDASTSTGGSGLMQNYRDGTRMELKELVHLMMTVSDNVATNMLCDWMGIKPVNAWLAQHGFSQTRMFSSIGGRMVDDKKGREEWGLGRTTPREMGDLLAMIAQGKAGDPASTDEMLRVLSHQYFDAGIPAGIPPTTYVGSKSGSLNRSRSDTAIVSDAQGKYVLSIYTKNNENTSWSPKNEAQLAIRKISNLIWRHRNPGSDYSPPPGVEKF